jgi:hypothetical protein
LLSVAREPGRPAATLALLAFSLGGLVFAVSYAATLRQGIAEQAAFAVGGDLLVTEAGTPLTASGTVLPLDRYAALGGDVVATPVIRRPGSVAGGGEVTVLGIEPTTLPTLRGWRADASATDPATIAAALDVALEPGLAGHDLPPGERTLRIELEHAGDPLDVAAFVAVGGETGRIPLGTLSPGHQVVEAALAEPLRGGRLVAIELREARFIAGEQHAARLSRATLAFHGLDGLVDERPIDVETSGVDVAIVRASAPTDGLVLPALVSPDVAATAAASADGTVRVALGSRASIAVRPIAVADRFPTVSGLGDRFVVVDVAALLTTLDAASPGAGHPDEAWLTVWGGDGAFERVVAALREPPFRSAAILSRPAIEHARASDPLSAAIVGSLVAAAGAGLLLAVLGLVVGASADWRDEAGELRDLAAQGLGPRALRRQAAARTAILAAGGVVAGLLVGLLLASIVTGAIGLAADRGTPVPPLRLVLPWPEILVLVAACLAVGAIGGSLIGRRSAAGRGGERRRDRSAALTAPEPVE